VISIGFILFFQPTFNEVNDPEIAFLNFIEGLDKKVVIGGEPCSLDNVLLYAKRKVLFSCERLNNDDSLMISSLSAYYGETGKEVYEFCNAEDVDFWVINENAFLPEFIEKGDYLSEPYNSYFAEIIKDRAFFVLENIPEELKLFQAGTLIVIACDDRLNAF
jgi:hypothetical protein